MDAIHFARVVNAATTSSGASGVSPQGGGLAFRQAQTQVNAITRTLSTALDQRQDKGLIASVMAGQEDGQRRLNRLLAQSQRTGSANNAPAIALEMVELGIRNDIAAKCVGKCVSGVQSLSTLS